MKLLMRELKQNPGRRLKAREIGAETGIPVEQIRSSIRGLRRQGKLISSNQQGYQLCTTEPSFRNLESMHAFIDSGMQRVSGSILTLSTFREPYGFQLHYHIKENINDIPKERLAEMQKILGKLIMYLSMKEAELSLTSPISK